MHRSHKIRLNPTAEQEAYFRKACGVARFAFNWGLAEIKRALDTGHKPESALALKQRFNGLKGEQFPWAYEVSKCAVEGAFRNLGAALANFWQSKRGERKGKRIRFPRFRSKRHGYGSFYLSNDKCSVDGHWLGVPKLGRVNMTEAPRFAGTRRGPQAASDWEPAVPVVATSARQSPVDSMSDCPEAAVLGEAGMDEYFRVLGK